MPFLKTSRLVPNTEIFRSLIFILLMKNREGKKGGKGVGIVYTVCIKPVPHVVRIWITQNFGILKACGSILISKALVKSVVVLRLLTMLNQRKNQLGAAYISVCNQWKEKWQRYRASKWETCYLMKTMLTRY